MQEHNSLQNFRDRIVKFYDDHKKEILRHIRAAPSNSVTEEMALKLFQEKLQSIPDALEFEKYRGKQGCDQLIADLTRKYSITSIKDERGTHDCDVVDRRAQCHDSDADDDLLVPLFQQKQQ